MDGAGAVLDAAGPGERSDPTSDPEAWVRIGARWMLSLCAAECERVAKAETARTGRGRGGVGEDDENEKDAADEKDADAKAGAARALPREKTEVEEAKDGEGVTMSSREKKNRSR